MKQFIVRIGAFILLIAFAIKSSAEHHLDRFYVCKDYHKPWYTLLKNLNWLRVPLKGLWEVSGDFTWSLPVSRWKGDDEGWNALCAHLACLMEEEEGSYYWVVKTRSGNLPWPMVRKFYHC